MPTTFIWVDLSQRPRALCYKKATHFSKRDFPCDKHVYVVHRNRTYAIGDRHRVARRGITVESFGLYPLGVSNFRWANESASPATQMPRRTLYIVVGWIAHGVSGGKWVALHKRIGVLIKKRKRRRLKYVWICYTTNCTGARGWGVCYLNVNCV